MVMVSAMYWISTVITIPSLTLSKQVVLIQMVMAVSIISLMLTVRELVIAWV